MRLPIQIESLYLLDARFGRELSCDDRDLVVAEPVLDAIRDVLGRCDVMTKDNRRETGVEQLA